MSLQDRVRRVRGRRKWVFGFTSAIVAAVLLASGLVAPTTSVLGPQTAVAKSSKPTKAHPKAATHRKGLRYGNTWVGTWNVWTPSGIKPGVCFQPTSGHPDSYDAWTLRGAVPGMSKADSANVKFATQKYGNTGSNTLAAGLNLYVWTVQDQLSFRGSLSRIKHSSHFKGAVKDMKAIARDAQNHGPYSGGGSIGKAEYGHTVHGSFTFKNSHGKAASNKRVHLSASGVALAHKSVITGPHGVASFSGRVKTIGTYYVRGTIVSPTSHTVLVSRASSKAHQRTAIYTGSTESKKVSVHNKGVVSAAKVVSTCGPNCHGTTPVETTKSNACGGAAERLFVSVNGEDVGKPVDIAPCKTGVETVVLHDTNTAVAQVCYLNHMGGNCVTGRVTVGSATVVCPPRAAVSYQAHCDCATGKVFRAIFTLPVRSSRHYVGRLYINHKLVESGSLVNGVFTTKWYKVKKGDEISVDFTVLNKTHWIDDWTQNL